MLHKNKNIKINIKITKTPKDKPRTKDNQAKFSKTHLHKSTEKEIVACNLFFLCLY